VATGRPPTPTSTTIRSFWTAVWLVSESEAKLVLRIVAMSSLPVVRVIASRVDLTVPSLPQR